MSKRDFPNSPPVVNKYLTAWVRNVLFVVLAGGVAASGYWWFFPLEVFQSWAVKNAGNDAYKQLEAHGRAEFSCWLIRFVAPMISLGAGLMLRSPARFAGFLAAAASCWLKTTDVDADGRRVRWKSAAFRGLFIAWAILSLGHAGQAIEDCMTSWGFPFRFHSGSQVLPNISDSNRDVIRFLMEATKPDARIFVASDQKLYFLSYYLLPRRLYYQVHPDAEFVVAQAFQRRRMDAYQLSEIDPTTIERINPDYILEYFEHPDFVDRQRLGEDQEWLAFYRRAHRDPSAEPNFVVRLRRFEKDLSR